MQDRRTSVVYDTAVAPVVNPVVPVSRRSRRLVGLAILSGVLLVAIVGSLAIGSQWVVPADVWNALVDPAGSQSDIIVRSLRLPRTVLGVIVGGALGVGGALMQGHTRNPLADPALLGVTHGAALAVVISVFWLGFTSLYSFVWFAFAGALIASAAVFALGSVGRGGLSPVRLALAGAAISALLASLISGIVLLDQRGLDIYRFWRVGALANRPPDIWWQILPFVLIGLVLAFANAPGLNALALGTDVAKALGQRVMLTRVIGLFAITLLTGAAVAACGPIGFVGLVVPHIARVITGPDHRWLLPYAGLLGASLTLIADTVGRVIGIHGELEVGIMLAVIGGPFFLILVRRAQLAKL